jgi:hypothetical protein
MAFWKKIFKSKYTGAEIDAAVAKAGTVPAVTSADAGKALVVDEEGKIVAGEVGGENLLIVTITGNPREGVFQSDKTFNEISAALTDGIPVIVNLDVVSSMSCVISKPGAIKIYSFDISGTTMYIDVFIIASNDAVTRESYSVSVTSL